MRRSWTVEDGLPQNSVRAVTQTPDGALWVGTFGGLARFDGRKFQCFTEGTTPELGSSFIVSLLVDRRGVLWIGSAEGRVASYADGLFRGFDRADGVPDGPITGLAEDHDGSILLAGAKAIRRWDGARFEDAVDLTSEAPISVKHIHVTASGTTLVATDAGLMRLQGRQLVPLPIEDGSACPPVSYVASSPELGVWAKLELDFAFLEGDRVAISRASEARMPGRVFGSTHLSDGTMLVSTGGELFGLKRVGDDLRLTHVDVSAPQPSALFVDREDNLWVGHLSRGLEQLARQLYIALDFTALGLVRGNLLFAAADGDDIWIASSGGGSVVRTNASAEIVPHPILSSGLGRIRGLLTTRDGSLWVHHDGGLRVWHESSIRDLECEVQAYTSALVEDVAGNVWIGGTDALVRFDARGNARRFTSADGLPQGVAISSLAASPDGTVWAGTDDGLLHLTNDGVFEQWTRAQGIPGGTIRALYPHGDDLWLGSYGGGLARWRSGQLARVDTSKGLFSDAVSALIGDDEGNLWVNSNRGAFRLKLPDLDAVADGRDEALACVAVRSPESGGRGGLRSKNGSVYFAGVDGLTRIDPDRVSVPTVEPGIELVSCTADGISCDLRQTIEVAPGPRELVFTFNGLSLTEPADVLFRFRLDGFDPSWRSGGHEGVARYTSVPPGTYRFEVMARSNAGTWSSKPASVSLTLQPYLHERAWFKIAGVALIVSIVAGAFFARSRAAGRRHQVLQREIDLRVKAEDSLRKLAGELIRAQEEERRRVALELHDDLGQRLALLSVGLDLLARDHSSTRGDVVDDVRAMADSVRSISSDVHDMSHRLHSTKLDKLGLQAALRILCQEVSTKHEIAIVFEAQGEAGRMTQDVELALYRIAQEALNNTLRHSDATSARVELKSASKEIRLIVEDDGQGFDASRPEHRAGLGLQGMHERMLLVGGALSIHSTPGAGTRNEAVVPLSRVGPNGSNGDVA